MRSALIVVGCSSHVLDGYRPAKHYAGRFNSVRDVGYISGESDTEFFELDLMSSKLCFDALIRKLDIYDEVDILFAAYSNHGLSEEDGIGDVQIGLMANCGIPIYFFQSLSRGLIGKRVRGVFVSSIYAHVAPNPKNYEFDSKINPLYYGVAKAGVEQGLRWLSVQDPNHTFNSIILGPMPKKTVCAASPKLVQNLRNFMSSGKIVDHDELHGLLDYLFGCGTSTRGASFGLDGGYLCY